MAREIEICGQAWVFRMRRKEVFCWRPRGPCEKIQAWAGDPNLESNAQKHFARVFKTIPTKLFPKTGTHLCKLRIRPRSKRKTPARQSKIFLKARRAGRNCDANSWTGADCAKQSRETLEAKRIKFTIFPERFRQSFEASLRTQPSESGGRNFPGFAAVS